MQRHFTRLFHSFKTIIPQKVLHCSGISWNFSLILEWFATELSHISYVISANNLNLNLNSAQMEFCICEQTNDMLLSLLLSLAQHYLNWTTTISEKRQANQMNISIHTHCHQAIESMDGLNVEMKWHFPFWWIINNNRCISDIESIHNSKFRRRKQKKKRERDEDKDFQLIDWILDISLSKNSYFSWFRKRNRQKKTIIISIFISYSLPGSTIENIYAGLMMYQKVSVADIQLKLCSTFI